MNKIFLIGMPAVGKSRIGAELANKAGVSFVDTDYSIMDTLGKSIEDIIEQHGILFFRKKENQILKKIIQSKESMVVSTGGGLPVYFDNLELMQSAGKVVWLKKDLEDVFKSFRSNPRAGLQINSLPQMKDLYDSRKEFYSQADFKIDVTSQSAEDFQSQLIAYV